MYLLLELDQIVQQAAGRGWAARTEARERKQKRVEEEARRASVWGQGEEGNAAATAADKKKRAQAPRASSPPSSSPRPSAKAPGSRASSSLFSSGPSNGGGRGGRAGRAESEAATHIQAAFRGGKARWEADQRRKEFAERKAEAKARAQQKVSDAWWPLLLLVAAGVDAGRTGGGFVSGPRNLWLSVVVEDADCIAETKIRGDRSFVSRFTCFIGAHAAQEGHAELPRVPATFFRLSASPGNFQAPPPSPPPSDLTNTRRAPPSPPPPPSTHSHRRGRRRPPCGYRPRRGCERPG